MKYIVYRLIHTNQAGLDASKKTLVECSEPSRFDDKEEAIARVKEIMGFIAEECTVLEVYTK